MRSTVTLLLFAVLTTSALGQVRSDRESANLVGKVKSIAETYSRYSGRHAEPRDTVVYDLQGNEVERLMISDFGESIGKTSRTFDGAGLLQKTRFENPKGKLVEESRHLYSSGKLTAILRYDAAGVLREKTEKIYDRIGDLSEEIYYDPTVARAKTVFRTDGKGKPIEIAFFLSTGERAVAPVGPCLGAHKLTFKYDEKRRVISKAAFEPDGTEKKSWTYAYDERGNLTVSTIKSTSSTTKYTSSYEYDSVGNWTKRTTVMEDDDHFLELMKKATGSDKSTPKQTGELSMPSHVSVRKITYYEK